MPAKRPLGEPEQPGRASAVPRGNAKGVMKQTALYCFNRGGKRDLTSFFDLEEHARYLPADVVAPGTR
jgi:hypothetical protein